jgi:chromosome segregation protein
VFLKSLTLKGFKSFAEATVLEFEPGVTAVVGPNGSGKSNVVDAIAWVLGAQAPSSMRSQKMDDVIFAGTAKRPALGRAEVSLTIDNSSGILPIEFTEVTVRRTLFRTGESEYALNGVPCRLLDVQELLSDAGVGRQQHVIVSQGQIDSVLNARPEDRRAIIEEAAGVLKFRRRKEKAERRLDSTEGNLLRVQDLLREVRRQLRPLERQADAARRHGDLQAEYQALRVHLAGREIVALRSRLGVLAEERRSAETAERQIRAELAALDVQVVEAEGELAARGDADVSDRLVTVEQLRERARGLAAVLHERRRAMERDRGQLLDGGVVANLEGEAARLGGELDDVVRSLAQLAPEADTLLDEEALFQAERERTLAAIDTAAATPGSGATGAAAEVRGELRTLRTGVDRTESELRRSRQRLADLQARIDRFTTETDRLRLECVQAETSEAPLVVEVELAENRRLEAEAEAHAATTAQQDAAGELSRWQARADALGLALDHARARAGTERLAGVPGVLGTLLEFVHIESGWEVAFEAAAGDALLSVLVEDPAAARRAIAHLASGNATGAVLALPSASSGAGTEVPQGCEPVRAHVRGLQPRVEALLDALLARAGCVSGGWADALDVALAHPGAVVVTRAGDRFSAAGWRFGTTGSGATAAALEEALTRTAAAKVDLAERDRELHHVRGALDTARHHERELAKRLEANDARFATATDALGRVQAQRRESQAELELVERATADLQERVDREQGRITELELLLPALEADEAAEAQAARHRGEVRAQLEGRTALLSGRRKDLEVRNAGLLERQQFIEQRLEETERRLAADKVAREEAAARRVQIELALAAIDRLAALVDARRITIEAELATLHELRRRQTDEVKGIAQRLDTARRRRVGAENELDEVRERGRRVEIEEAEMRMRLEAAVETVRRELGAEPDDAIAAEAPPLPEGLSALTRVKDLEREIRLLGPINPLALEEFNTLQERHRFLEEQLEDVKETRRELSRVIKAVDQEIQTVFASAFADVAHHFTNLFAMLFPGGTGKLVLTDPENMLNTGIEVEAKPSGKNVKKLSLLSGGERSLTALAYLFAVFRSRPSPFYVMDEVEAALDDVNLHRFLGLVAEFRTEAQLIVVSHQKRTMEAADVLLGVTMQPGGSSKVVSERVGAARPS